MLIIVWQQIKKFQILNFICSESRTSNNQFLLQKIPSIFYYRNTKPFQFCLLYCFLKLEKKNKKKKKVISFGFQCPFHIISPGLDTGQFKNNIFQMRPEIYQLQWIIQPADSDAEVCVMWRHMVYAMMYSWHYNMKILKDCYVPRQTEIGVAPLVDLI